MTCLDLTPPATRDGVVLHPGDHGWDAARQAFNLLVDQRPDAIALPATAADVAAAVTEARRRGWRVTAQGTGHNAAPLGDLGGTLLINTSRLTDGWIDPAERLVRVGAGSKWERVVPRLSDLGLAALHGSSPDVGIAGYSLGGGMGWLSRRHGLQANAVVAFDLVTADGELVRVDATHEPDLFWALRGGGGSFGVVTAVEFRVLPVRRIHAGALFFPVARAAEVLATWRGLLPTFPDELTTWTALLQFPPLPFVPAHLQGRAFAVVMGAFLGEPADGRALLRDLAALGPQFDTFASVPPLGLAELAMDPPRPLPYLGAHELLGPVPASALEELAAAADVHPGGPLVLVQLRHTGGALARPAPEAGARATLPGELSLFGVGMVTGEDSARQVRQALAGVTATVAGHRAGHYPNFVEEPADASRFFDPVTWARLRAVKGRYDPDDLVRGNHHVPPARPTRQSESSASRVLSAFSTRSA